MTEPNLLTMEDVARIETTCLTGGEHIAFSANAMLLVLRSYRQAVTALAVASPKNEFLKAIGGKEIWRES